MAEVEAIRAIQELASFGLHLHRLTATCDGDDAAYLKSPAHEAGLRFEGLFTQDRFGATALDTAYYAILAEEFVWPRGRN